MMNEAHKNTDTENQPDAESRADAQTETGTTAPLTDSLKKELEEAKNQMLRAMAEADNTRKRAVKEREDASKYAVTKFARDVLSVADNLRRALDAMPGDAAASDPRVKNLIDGIEATERELLKSFQAHGIRKIDPADELFNPNFHEVIFETPGTGKPPGTIIQVVETGYILHDRLLRPARVGVAKDEGQGDGKKPGAAIDTSA